MTNLKTYIFKSRTESSRVVQAVCLADAMKVLQCWVPGFCWYEVEVGERGRDG